jgi:hypothetical protein
MVYELKNADRAATNASVPGDFSLHMSSAGPFTHRPHTEHHQSSTRSLKCSGEASSSSDVINDIFEFEFERH